MTLLDSVGKKIRACKHFAEVLGLEIEAVHMRAESLAAES
jgi:16S rRNA G527 N7-methylase RsmG